MSETIRFVSNDLAAPLFTATLTESGYNFETVFPKSSASILDDDLHDYSIERGALSLVDVMEAVTAGAREYAPDAVYRIVVEESDG